jgi:uncharacterized protein with HEPN domain
MSKDPQILLKHILESIAQVQSYLANMDEEDYMANVEKQDAAERRLQVIGQSIVSLPQEFKDAHQEIEWAKIAGLRNRLVHEYLEIDHELIWNIIAQSLPEFQKAIENLLQ